MGEDMRKDNRGISLVEIIMVLALMTVVAGMLMYGIGLISGKPAQKCANKIVLSLDRHRTTAMGKAVGTSYKLKTKSATDKTVILEETIVEADGTTKVTEIPIGEDTVVVNYTCGSTVKTLDESGLTLEFVRGSGAFKPQPDSSGGAGTDYCTEIVVSKAGKDYKIELVPLTGKVHIKE